MCDVLTIVSLYFFSARANKIHLYALINCRYQNKISPEIVGFRLNELQNLDGYQTTNLKKNTKRLIIHEPISTSTAIFHFVKNPFMYCNPRGFLHYFPCIIYAANQIINRCLFVFMVTFYLFLFLLSYNKPFNITEDWSIKEYI